MAITPWTTPTSTSLIIETPGKLRAHNLPVWLQALHTQYLGLYLNRERAEADDGANDLHPAASVDDLSAHVGFGRCNSGLDLVHQRIDLLGCDAKGSHLASSFSSRSARRTWTA